MTPSGARQHLAALVDEGFAEATERPRPAGQRGRPQLEYTVTDKADGLFPKAYGELTNELLGYVAEADAGLVDTLFERRRDERVRNATERLGEMSQPESQGRRADPHPRRRRLPGDVGGDPRRLPHHRAQLRDLGGRAALRAGMHQRDRLHPHRAARARASSACSTWSLALPIAPYEVRPSR